MFHAHKTEFAEKGWMGTFLVKDENKSMNESNLVKSIANNLQPLVGRGSD